MDSENLELRKQKKREWTGKKSRPGATESDYRCWVDYRQRLAFANSVKELALINDEVSTPPLLVPLIFLCQPLISLSFLSLLSLQIPPPPPQLLSSLLLQLLCPPLPRVRYSVLWRP